MAYLDLPGTDGSYASTSFDWATLIAEPHFELRLTVKPEAWVPSSGQALISESSTVRFIFWNIQTDGSLRITWRDGSDTVRVSASAVTGLSGKQELRLVFDGRGADTVVRFEHRVDPDDPWTLITSNTHGVTGLTRSSGTAYVGGRGSSVLMLDGAVYGAEIRDGEEGPLVASPDFTTQAPGTTEFTDAQGNTWTLHGDAEILPEGAAAFGPSSAQLDSEASARVASSASVAPAPALCAADLSALLGISAAYDSPAALLEATLAVSLGGDATLAAPPPFASADLTAIVGSDGSFRAGPSLLEALTIAVLAGEASFALPAGFDAAGRLRIAGDVGLDGSRGRLEAVSSALVGLTGRGISAAGLLDAGSSVLVSLDGTILAPAASWSAVKLPPIVLVVGEPRVRWQAARGHVRPIVGRVRVRWSSGDATLRWSSSDPHG